MSTVTEHDYQYLVEDRSLQDEQDKLTPWTCPYCAALSSVFWRDDHECMPDDVAFYTRCKVAGEAFAHFMDKHEPGTAAEIYSLLALKGNR